MNIKLTGLGALKKYVKAEEMDIAPGTTCRELIKALAIPEVFKTVAFVNGVETDLDVPISEPCEVKLVTLIRGG